MRNWERRSTVASVDSDGVPVRRETKRNRELLSTVASGNTVEGKQ